MTQGLGGDGVAKPVIGLIGGIGSGKSQVAILLARRGGHIVSGDALGHEALRQPAVRDAIVARWGRGVLDEHGEVDRRRLGTVVFATQREREALEAMVHPWIKERIGQEVAAARDRSSVVFVVLDAAVMLEAGWDGPCDRLVYVEAPRGVRLRRVAGQRGWTETELAGREGAQLPLTLKAARADHVLVNASTLEDLERQVDDLLRLWGLDGQPAAPDQARGERDLSRRCPP